MMILTKHQDNNELFYNLKDLNNALWNPIKANETEVLMFTITGKTYNEKKEALREIAKTAQIMDCGGLGWWEESEIAAWFEVQARRYGLTKELRENGFPV